MARRTKATGPVKDWVSRKGKKANSQGGFKFGAIPRISSGEYHRVKLSSIKYLCVLSLLILSTLCDLCLSLIILSAFFKIKTS